MSMPRIEMKLSWKQTHENYKKKKISEYLFRDKGVKPQKPNNTVNSSGPHGNTLSLINKQNNKLLSFKTPQTNSPPKMAVSNIADNVRFEHRSRNELVNSARVAAGGVE